jgi:O-antigen/teichoic acid export membrane protein
MVAVFGEPFVAAAPAFSVYIWLLPLRLMSGHARWTLLADERQNLLLGVEIAGALTLVLVGLALVPGYGAVGASAAVVIANIVAWIAAHKVASRVIGDLPGVRDVLVATGSTLGSLALGMYFHENVVLSVGAAVAAFLVCMKLAGGDLFADVIRLAHAKQSHAD